MFSIFRSQVAATSSQPARVAHEPTSQAPAWTAKATFRNPSKRENSQPSLLNSNEKFTFWQRFSTFRRKPLNVPSEFRCYQGAVVVVVVAVLVHNLSSTFTSQVAAAGSQLARVAHDPTSQAPAWTPKATLRNPSKRENSQTSLLNSDKKLTIL